MLSVVAVMQGEERRGSVLGVSINPKNGSRKKSSKENSSRKNSFSKVSNKVTCDGSRPTSISSIKDQSSAINQQEGDILGNHDIKYAPNVFVETAIARRANRNSKKRYKQKDTNGNVNNKFQAFDSHILQSNEASHSRVPRNEDRRGNRPSSDGNVTVKRHSSHRSTASEGSAVKRRTRNKSSIATQTPATSEESQSQENKELGSRKESLVGGASSLLLRLVLPSAKDKRNSRHSDRSTSPTCELSSSSAKSKTTGSSSKPWFWPPIRNSEAVSSKTDNFSPVETKDFSSEFRDDIIKTVKSVPFPQLPAPPIPMEGAGDQLSLASFNSSLAGHTYEQVSFCPEPTIIENDYECNPEREPRLLPSPIPDVEQDEKTRFDSKSSQIKTEPQKRKVRKKRKKSKSKGTLTDNCYPALVAEDFICQPNDEISDNIPKPSSPILLQPSSVIDDEWDSNVVDLDANNSIYISHEEPTDLFPHLIHRQTISSASSNGEYKLPIIGMCDVSNQPTGIPSPCSISPENMVYFQDQCCDRIRWSEDTNSWGSEKDGKLIRKLLHLGIQHGEVQEDISRISSPNGSIRRRGVYLPQESEADYTSEYVQNDFHFQRSSDNLKRRNRRLFSCPLNQMTTDIPESPGLAWQIQEHTRRASLQNTQDIKTRRPSLLKRIRQSFRRPRLSETLHSDDENFVNILTGEDNIHRPSPDRSLESPGSDIVADFRRFRPQVEAFTPPPENTFDHSISPQPAWLDKQHCVSPEDFWEQNEMKDSISDQVIM